MKKIFVFVFVLFVLFSGVTIAFACGDVIESNLLPGNSKYVGEATVIVRYYGEAEKDKTYTWTALEVFWPGKDCFVDGDRTVRIFDLSRKSGYSWTKEGNEYCIVKN